MNSKERQYQLRHLYGEKARRLPQEVIAALDVLLEEIPKSRYQLNLHDAVIKALLQSKVTPTHKQKQVLEDIGPIPEPKPEPIPEPEPQGRDYITYALVSAVLLEMGYRYWPLLLSL